MIGKLKIALINFKKRITVNKAISLPSNLESSFRESLVMDNARRLFILMISFFIIETILLLLILTSILNQYAYMMTMQIIIIFFSLAVSFVIRYFIRQKSVRALRNVIIWMHIMSLALASFYSMHTLSYGNVSYAGYMIGAVIVFLTFIQKKYVAILFYIISFSATTIYAVAIHSLDRVMIVEIINALFLIILLCVGSSLNYDRYKKLFIQEHNLNKANKQLKVLSTLDELTGLFCRRKIDSDLIREIKVATRYKIPLTVVFIDIDYFKNTNDTHGHIIGDKVLQEFAAILKACARNTDILGRWGGEEFVVFCVNTSKESALILIERMRKTVEAHMFQSIGRITFSAGIAQLQDNEKSPDIINRADKALYEAKDSGRNCIKVT